MVHQLAKTLERLHNFGDIGDDGVGIVVGNLGQEMLLDGGVNGEFHFLGVDHHELQFRRVLFVKQRSDDGIQTNRFTLTGGTGYKEVGHLGQIDHEHFVGNGFTQCDG